VITNLTFSGGDSIYIGGTAGASGGVGPIIHDCIFIQPSSGNAMVKFQNNGGVLYKNTFTAQSGWIAAYFLAFKDATNLAEWQTNSTMGAADTTGMNNTYIEGNTFSYSGAAAFDLDDASRTVIRYNTFNNSAIAGHGFCTSAVGVRHYEILNNAFNYTFYSTDQGNVANGWIRPRGGTGVVAGNTFADITGWGSKADFTIADWMIGSACNCSGQYGGCCTSYPCVRQTSVSWNNGGYIIDPLYLGGNTHTGQTNGIILGLDGCSPYCGSLAITDIDQQGRNYNYTTKPGYTPYTCPHPLAGSGTCSGVGAAGYSLTGGSPPPPPPTSPSPPQNLQVQP
jgi:parallel beta-helix repeat protein